MKLLKVLGYLWSLPNTLVGLIFLGLLALLKQVIWVGPDDGVLRWFIVKDSWVYRNWSQKGWAAITLGANVTYSPGYLFDWLTNIHERRHVQQNWVLGPFMYPIYLIVGIWSYAANPFEVDAYEYAKTHQHDPVWSLW